MAENLNTVYGKLTPVYDRVLVTDMHFGEQVTSSGIIIQDDDKTTRGIYSRWGKVYAKGSKNNDPYKVGDWVLVEHGRWSRGIDINEGQGPKTIRMVDNDSILAYQEEKPTGVLLGEE